VVLAGVDEEGREVANDVTDLILDVVEELHISDFPIAVRISKRTPERLLRRVAAIQRLGGGIVAMEAEIDGKRVMARGAIGSDGRFTLASQRPDDGAFAGTYRVRVLPQVVIDGPATRGLDPRFQSFDTSGLSFEVGSGKNEFTISLGPKPAP
jgi:hypothetical protein